MTVLISTKVYLSKSVKWRIRGTTWHDGPAHCPQDCRWQQITLLVEDLSAISHPSVPGGLLQLFDIEAPFSRVARTSLADNMNIPIHSLFRSFIKQASTSYRLARALLYSIKPYVATTGWHDSTRGQKQQQLLRLLLFLGWWWTHVADMFHRHGGSRRGNCPKRVECALCGQITLPGTSIHG